MRKNTIIRYEVETYYRPQKVYGVRRVYQRTDVKQAISVPTNHGTFNHKFVCYLLVAWHYLLDTIISIDDQRRIKAWWREVKLTMQESDIELQTESV